MTGREATCASATAGTVIERNVDRRSRGRGRRGSETGKEKGQTSESLVLRALEKVRAFMWIYQPVSA